MPLRQYYRFQVSGFGCQELVSKLNLKIPIPKLSKKRLLIILLKKVPISRYYKANFAGFSI
jgi:hypothetical protein